jgi:hypothetical protein
VTTLADHLSLSLCPLFKTQLLALVFLLLDTKKEGDPR